MKLHPQQTPQKGSTPNSGKHAPNLADFTREIKDLSTSAAERGLSLYEGLKLITERSHGFTFNRDDFSQKLKSDLALAAEIVLHGLSLGHSYSSLRTNISLLCSQNPDPGHLKPAADDQKPLRVALVDKMRGHDVSDYAESVVHRSLESLHSKSTLALDGACLSALYSFLQSKKVIISKDAIMAFRAKSLSSETFWDKVNRQEPGQAWKTLRMPKAQTHQISPILARRVLLSQSPKFVFNACNKLAAQVDDLCASMLLPDGSMRPQKRSAEDRVTASEFFLNNPKKLQQLFTQAFEHLRSGLETKDFNGYPDPIQSLVLFSSPVNALVLAENLPDAFAQIFGLYCSLLGNAGRIVQPLYKHDDPRREKSEKIYPKVSAAVAAGLLSEFPEIPESVRNEIILVISHGVKNSELSRLTQSVDIQQLIGPEAITRELYSAMCEGREFYPEAAHTGTSVCEALSSALHNFPYNPRLISNFESRLLVTSGVFLRLASSGSKETKPGLFQRESNPPGKQNPLSEGLDVAIKVSLLTTTQDGLSKQWPDLWRRLEVNGKLPALALAKKLFTPPPPSSYSSRLSGEAERSLERIISVAEKKNTAGLKAALLYAVNCIECLHKERERDVSILSRDRSPVFRAFVDAIAPLLGPELPKA